MKIFDAVYTAAVFLRLDELCSALSADGFDKNDWRASLDADNARELDMLLRCCNLTLGELAEGDFPLKTKIRVKAENGRIDYAAFPEKATDILAVEASGATLPFQSFFDCVTVPYNGECTVTYTFAPPRADLGDYSPYAGNKPSARLAAYGIAREYCLINGMTDDAAMWDGRFAAAATEEARGRGDKKVRARKWR